VTQIAPTATVAADTRPCRASDLAPGSHANGATGSIFLGAWFTNTGGSPCYLPTWLGVTLLDSAGQALQVDYVYWDMTSLTPEAGATEQATSGATARLALVPGQSAGFDLLWRNWCGADLGGRITIRVALGQETIDLPTDLPGGARCDSASAGSTVSVAALQIVSP
jgi:hypothetical protein